MESNKSNLLHKAVLHINEFLGKHNITKIKYEDTKSDKISDSVVDSVSHLSECLSNLAAEQKKIESSRKIDASIVQITATNEQLNERIRAFMSHAQNVVDEQNIKEFCDSQSTSTNAGCARTDACYKSRGSNSTHMQVSKAINAEGPQLRISSQGLWREPTTNKPIARKPQSSKVPQPIAERLYNIESHLKTEHVDSSDVYGRLKNLENRILAIEGTSPEYFIGSKQDHKIVTNSSILAESQSVKLDHRDYSLQEIDDRIRMLKQELSSKKRKLDEGLTFI